MASFDYKTLKSHVVMDLIYDPEIMSANLNTPLMQTVWKNIQVTVINKWILSTPTAIFTEKVLKFYARAKISDDSNSITSFIGQTEV